MVIGAPKSATVITSLLDVRQVMVWIAWACLSVPILYLFDLSWHSMAISIPTSISLSNSHDCKVEYLQKSAWMLDKWQQVTPNRSVKWLLMWKSRQFVEDWNTSLRTSRRSECVACNMSNLDAGFHSLLVFEVVIFSYLKCLLVSSWNCWRSQMVTMLSWIAFSAPRYVYPLLDAGIHAVHWRLHGTRSLYFSGCLVKPCDLFVQICKFFTALFKSSLVRIWIHQ